MEGYATFFGDEAYFEGESTFVDPDGTLDARLERGWARRVRVPSSETGETIPGVEVRIDGEGAATTDVKGEAHLKRALQPTTVEFVHTDWNTSAGSETGDAFGLGAHRLWHKLPSPFPLGRARTDSRIP